jgi:hypothetical protein
VRGNKRRIPAGLTWLFPIALAVFAAPAAASTVQGNAVIAKWNRMDICARRAQTAHPAYTAEENAARQAALQRCLEQGNLPPRQPLAPPQPR